MRIILSRKGFDSSAGGCPSPILPDGSLCSLPIPDSQSLIRYADLNCHGVNMGSLVEHLTRGKSKRKHRAHLDPDLNAHALPREPGWRGILGQMGSAQGHLREQQVAPGDLFLFFGLFREVQQIKRKWSFVPNSRPRHVLWGWLQIESIVRVDDLAADELSWARYHPHFQYGPDRNNVLYLAAEQLVIDGKQTGIPGSGTFGQIENKLVLTAPDARLTSYWRLPEFFHPTKTTQLSYHLDRKRWTIDGDVCHLRSAGRGQEFVLTGADDAEVSDWLRKLLLNAN
ncbi:hypothetical protein F6455_01020 [Proteobacteria bacterium 005FR1]|nr:hypothetical protein [Proteobacteria bacterium 005FR1]